MRLFPILPLSGAIVLFIIAIFVYTRNKNSLINVTYALFLSSLILWLTGFFLSYLTKNQKLAYFWQKIGYSGIILLPSLSYSFLVEFLNVRKLRYTSIISVVISVVFIVILWASNLLVNGTWTHDLGFYYIRASILQPYFLVFFVICFAEEYVLMFLQYRENKRKGYLSECNRISYVIAAILVGNFGVIDFIPMYGISLRPFGFIFMILMVSIFGYAIVKHHLMGIEIIIKKTLVFAGLFASVFTILVLPALLIQEYIFRNASAGGRLLGLILSGVIITLSLRRIENFLINVTDKYLFQKKYNYRELLRTFTSEVLTVVNLDKLVNLTVDKLTDIVRVGSSAVLLLDEEKQQFDLVASRNVKDPKMSLLRPDGVVTFLEQTHGYLLKKELIDRKVYIPPSIQEIIDKLNAELIIPMVLHTDVIGILSLGKKKSDEDYTQDDLDILLPLARTLTMAISNARLFSELGKAQAEAAQREKMATIGTLAAGMAHEIRNPITTIRNFADYLPERYDDKDFMDKFDKLIPKEIDRIENIARSLLEFSSTENIAKDEEFFIDDSVKTVMSLLEPQYRTSEIKIMCDFSKRHIVKGNKVQLQDIIFNIMNYIMAETAQGSSIIIECAARAGEKGLKLYIRSRGLVVPEHVIKDVFEPVSGLHREKRGFGFNIFVAKQLIERGGGELTILSDKSTGSEFSIKLKNASG